MTARHQDDKFAEEFDRLMLRGESRQSNTTGLMSDAMLRGDKVSLAFPRGSEQLQFVIEPRQERRRDAPRV